MKLQSKRVRFSIVTAVYNDRQGLQSTLDSIVSQQLSDYEWIVIDGASTDGTPEFLASLDLAGFTYVSEPDRGIYDAMNKGRRVASGEYILFLNAGDIFPSDLTLKNVDSILAGAPETDILLGGARFLFPNGRQLQRKPRRLEKYIWHGVPANHQATYYRTDLLRDPPYDLRFKICGDYFLACTLFMQGARAGYYNDTVVVFRIGDTSYKNPKKIMIEPFIIQQEVLKLSLLKSCLSVLKRIVSTGGIYMLSQNRH